MNDDAFAILAGRCVECGMIGPHSTHHECIAALRNRLARLELKIVSMREKAKEEKCGPGQRKRK